MAANLGNWQNAIDRILQNAEGLEIFKQLTSFEDRVAFIDTKDYLSMVEWLPFYLENCHRIHLKSAEKSKQLREQGNTLFQNKKYEDALALYTKAVLNAPSDKQSPELSLGYGNRSAALFYLGRYKGCVGDIRNAILNGYPDHLLHKVYLRKAQCHAVLGNVESAEKSLQRARECISKNQHLDQKKKVTFLQDIVNCAKKIPQQEESAACQPECEENGSDPIVSGGRNPLITQASSAIKMEFTTGKGRHLVATELLPAGSTLIVERPYAAVLLPDHYNTHCHHCFGLLECVVPCCRCTQVQYCCETCRDKSWTSYHSVECHYLDLLHSIQIQMATVAFDWLRYFELLKEECYSRSRDVGVAHLSIRIILVTGLSSLIDFKEEYKMLCESDRIGGVTKEGRYERNYLSVYDLLPHSDKMQMEDIFQYTLTGSLLLKILKSVQWFPQVSKATNEQMKPMDIELYIGGLLVRHILQLVCNAHAITELHVSQTSDKSVVETKSQVRVATAIYPTASLMNHSCDPTIISSFDRDLLVVRAVKDVPKDREIFNCYGPHHKRMNRRDRQVILREQYMFECDCEACVQEETDDLIFSAFKCPKCATALREVDDLVVCATCGLQDQMICYKDRFNKAHGFFVKALQSLENQNVLCAVELLLECYTIQKQLLYKFHRSLAETQDCLAKCYSLIGKFESSSLYLKESIETVRELYGDKSIEYANELHKYAEVLASAGKSKMALKATTESLTLFQLHYGSKHVTVNELEELKSNLKQVLNIS